jgi:hypothetical protein
LDSRAGGGKTDNSAPFSCRRIVFLSFQSLSPKGVESLVPESVIMLSSIAALLLGASWAQAAYEYDATICGKKMYGDVTKSLMCPYSLSCLQRESPTNLSRQTMQMLGTPKAQTTASCASRSTTARLPLTPRGTGTKISRTFTRSPTFALAAKTSPCASAVSNQSVCPRTGSSPPETPANPLAPLPTPL